MNITADGLHDLAGRLAWLIALLGLVLLGLSVIFASIDRRGWSIVCAIAAGVCAGVVIAEYVFERRHRTRYEQGEW